MKGMIQIYPRDLASQFYDDETFVHCARVVDYVKELAYWNDASQEARDDLMAVAWLHDILEDTNCSPDLLGEYYQAVEYLTHDKQLISYNEYLENIKNHSDNYWGKIAYQVKLADMKDHLNQKATLTDKLKEKYLSGLAVLL